METIYAWVENIAFYGVLQMIVRHLIPEGEQKKYVMFFMGLVLILILFKPVLTWSGQLDQLNFRVAQGFYEQEQQAFLWEQKRLEERWEQYGETILKEEEVYGRENAGSGAEEPLE